MIDKYLSLIQEGYIFSDKTLSFDLDKFESGESNKLLIIGSIGAGKTTTSKYLAKKNNAMIIHTDDCISWSLDQEPDKNQIREYTNCLKKRIIDNNKNKCIIEGLGIFSMLSYHRKLFIRYPMIIIGTSALLSSYRAFTRNNKNNEERLLKLLYNQTKMNFSMLQKKLSDLKEERSKVPGTIVKEFTEEIK